jgi:hypothetical protein
LASAETCAPEVSEERSLFKYKYPAIKKASVAAPMMTGM